MAATHNSPVPRWRGQLDIDNGVLPTAVSQRDRWLLQAVGAIGSQFKYSDEDFVQFGAEYFYNQAGYDSPDIYPWLFATGTNQTLYFGEHYIGD